MVKKTIILVTGPETNKANQEYTVDLFNKYLGERYSVIAPQLDYNDIDVVKQQLKCLTDDKNPIVLVGIGFGCLFVHQFAGHDRICLNPIMSVLEYGDYQNQLTDEQLDKYLTAEKQQYAYNRTEDHKNDTHCWGIYQNDEIVKNRHFSMLYYPQIITQPDTTIDEDLVTNVLASLLENIGRSSYEDECGVFFRNYGRTIVGVDPVLFNHVDEYEVPSGVTTISNECFANTNLKKLTIPSSVELLGKAMCEGCADLSEVIFESPSHIGYISEDCFADCESLKQIILPPSVFSIQDGGFDNSGIEEIIVDGDLQHLPTFRGCGKVYIRMKANKLSEILNELNRRKEARYASEYKQYCDYNPIDDEDE